MAANMADLFGESDDDDDDFAPFPGQTGENTQQDRLTDLKEGAAPIGGPQDRDREEDDDEDDFQDRPAPSQPAQLQDYSDEDDEEGIVREAYERPVGPPAELKGALLPLPAINKLRLLQTSKFLGVQTLPMTPENLKTERESAELDEVTNEVRYAYKKQLTIRWRERQLPSGESVVESNARFVTWSDGSKQLLLGDEVLDIGELDNTSANQFLFVRHTGPIRFIQGQGQLTKKMQLRPASLSSKFHKQLTADAQKKHVRVSKVKATATVADPNRAKADREKAEEERIKSREMLQRRQDKEMKKYPAVQRREYKPAGITPHFLETIEDEPDYSDEEDLTATERARSALRRRRLEEEEEREAEQRLARAKQAEPQAEVSPAVKRPRQESAPTRDPGTQRALLEESDEEDEADGFGTRQPSKKARRGLVLSDDEDE